MTSIAPEFILFFSVLIYKQPERAVPFLAACLLHELGHIAMLHCMKHCRNNISVGFHGMQIHAAGLSYRQILLATAAGPAANFFGLLLAPLSPSFAFYNLALGIYNLLPLPFLDGGSILSAALSMGLAPDQVHKIENIVFRSILLCIVVAALFLIPRLGLLPLLIAALLIIRCIQYSFLVS